MSRIYFHSEAGDAEILGSERAWLGSISDDVGMSIVDANSIRAMAKWLTFDIHGRTVDSFTLNGDLADATRLALKYADEKALSYQGATLSPWNISLNTALRLGSRPVQLAARIHAQCEIHGWVDGPNRAWLADIIDEGLASRVLRHRFAGGRDPGWQSLVAFLRSDAQGPVVMSYSVTDSFPDPMVSTWEPPDEYDGDLWDAWGELPDAEKWRTSMDLLRSQADRGLEFKPDDWSTYVFGHNGLTWMDLEEGEARLREVLEMDTAETKSA